MNKCKCGNDHNAPMFSGESSGFGLSFADGSHSLTKRKRNPSRLGQLCGYMQCSQCGYPIRLGTGAIGRLCSACRQANS